MLKWMNNSAEQLGALKDYAFLSTPESNAVFIVERNGIIWQQHEKVSWSIDERQRPPLLNWTDYVSVNADWFWLDGYLPVLEIKDQTKSIKVFSFKGKLYIDLENSAFEAISMHKISQADINEKITSIRTYWQDRLSHLSICNNSEWCKNALKASFVLTECTYSGLHPHYGTGFYGLKHHDSFPPTTIRVVETYLKWGEVDRAGKIFKYFLDNFIDESSGEIKYYGPSLAEYGMLLELVTLFNVSSTGQKWLKANIAKSQKLAKAMLKLLNTPTDVDKNSGLLIGSPEADEAQDIGVFIHNNAFVAIGLEKWGILASDYALGAIATKAVTAGRNLTNLVRTAIDNFKEKHGFVPYRLDGKTVQPEKYYESRKAGYANYRYYPEMLESGILTQDEAEQIVYERLNRGGEEFGMTVFPNNLSEYNRTRLYSYHYDNWTIISYLKAMINYNLPEAFKRTFAGHILFHMCHDTYIAYEQVYKGGDIRTAYADYCVPSQLALPMMYLLAKEASNMDIDNLIVDILNSEPCLHSVNFKNELIQKSQI